MRAALPLYLALVDEPHEGLVDERRGLEGVTLALTAQLAPGEQPQFVVDEWNDAGERAFIALAPSGQQVGDTSGRSHVADPGPSVRRPAAERQMHA